MKPNHLKLLTDRDVDIGTYECKTVPSEKVPGFINIKMEAHLPPPVAKLFVAAMRQLVDTMSMKANDIREASGSEELDDALKITAQRKMWLENKMED